MPKLETRGFVFDDKLDEENEMEVEASALFLFVNKEEAIKIVKHLKEKFEI